MQTELSPKMSVKNFQKILDALKAVDPTAHKPVTVITDNILKDLDAYPTYRNITVNPEVRRTFEGVPYGTGDIADSDGNHVAAFILFWSETKYALSAALTNMPDKAFTTMHAVIKDVDGRCETTRARAAFMKPRWFDQETYGPNSGIPLYVERAIELYLDESCYARTEKNKKLLYQEILDLTTDEFEPAQLNWLAFASAMLNKENAFTNALEQAFDTYDAKDELDCSEDPLPEDCGDRDFFANPNANWPASSVKPE